ncbi:MAG: magnesium transporter CorA family protein [Hyphomicrobium sp.]|jgi:magnesium transporter|uniref:magnesium transporter CorA family protein n=1 Tax=Hyphomicrobium sp. TaxID=82 RepID=UPI0025B84DAB|nr:magnesium transporter CorA family protein [Hyphomicrobium sp.]MBX9862787.1 magnesium transporter CorA family protein [Hyphomicrobium sp.]
MLTIYDTNGESLVRHNETAPISPDTVWYDLLNPTKEEDNHVEALLKISVPTRAEMREIEASSRFYHENGASYMTGFIAHNIDEQTLGSSTLTFILTGNALVTVRYSDTKAFPTFLSRVERRDATCRTGASIMVGLIETLIEQQADLIVNIQDRVEKIAQGIFSLDKRRTRDTKLDVLLKGIGKQGDMVARLSESATSIERVLHVLRNTAQERNCDGKIFQRIGTTDRDLKSLSEHMRFLSDRIGFLLNATLGLISNEQNQIIKLFSVMAVMLMPPTLVASIYGMNFEHMPEIKWLHGYPMALGLMVISAVIPFLYFRRKGWL